MWFSMENIVVSFTDRGILPRVKLRCVHAIPASVALNRGLTRVRFNAIVLTSEGGSLMPVLVLEVAMRMPRIIEPSTTGTHTTHAGV